MFSEQETGVFLLSLTPKGVDNIEAFLDSRTMKTTIWESDLYEKRLFQLQLELIIRRIKGMWADKSEIEENKFLFDDNNRIVDKRFESCCKWFIRKACRYKRIYMSMTLLGGLCPIISAVLTGIDFGIKCVCFGKIILITLSIATSVSVLILNVTRAQDKWTKYRVSSEFLKRERTFYLLGKENHQDSMHEWDEQFLKNIEEYMVQENKDWEKANSSKANSDNSSEQKEGQ